MDFLRQRAFFDPDETHASVTVVGCGGVGSFAAFALAKLGVQKLVLLDPDVVEEHNVPNQMFTLKQASLGEPKVEALADVVRQFADPEEIVLMQARLEDAPAHLFNSDVVVSALDSMEARAALWERLRFKLQPRLLLDARLAGEYVVLYSVRPSRPSDVAGYERTLHSDDEALEVSCTARGVIDVGFQVASLITRAVRKHHAGEEPTAQLFVNQATLEVFSGAFPPDLEEVAS